MMYMKQREYLTYDTFIYHMHFVESWCLSIHQSVLELCLGKQVIVH